MKMKRLSLWTSCLLLVFVIPCLLISSPASCKESDEEAIYAVIHKLQTYYERRKASKFINLFSRRKFYNYISFKTAVENDFDLYRDIQLKRFNEHLYYSDANAVYRAVWEKRYRATLDSPFQKQKGLVTILLEKHAGRWWIVDLQGYPIFGTSKRLRPDLTVTNVWIMGGGRRIVGVVKNIGHAAASSFYVGFYAGETFLGKAFVAKMDKGKAQNISWVWTPDPSRRLSDIRVVADVTDKVNETREDNNVGKIVIKPGNTTYCVDLSIDDRGLYVPSSIQAGTPVQVGNTVTQAPKGNVKTVKVGDKVRICVEFHNIGGLNASSVPVKVYYATERPDKTVTIFQRVYPIVPSKGKIRFCFFWIVPELERKPSKKTKRYIRVVLDPDNSLPECSEGNNAAEQEIAIVSSIVPPTPTPTPTPTYDGILTVSNPAISPNDDCPLSDVITMTVTVRDQDLVNQNKVLVTIATDIHDIETFYLPRISPGVFRRTTFASCKTHATPTPRNGRLEVNSAGLGTLTVKYTDQQDSQGKTVVRSQTIQYVP